MKHLTLRDYQERMLAHQRANPRCALFVSPGLGKTPVTLTYLTELKASGAMKLALVVAPPRVASGTWPGEAAEWSNFSTLTVRSLVAKTAAKRVKLLKAAIADGADVLTVNFESFEAVLKLLNELRISFDTLIVDEASKLRGLRLRQGTKRAKLMYDASRRCARIVELTGSPAPKGLMDLYGLSLFLDDGQRLGKSFFSFAESYFSVFELPNGGRIYTPLKGALERVTGRIKDVCLSMRPEQVFKVNKPQIIPVPVTLSPEARAHYDELERENITKLGDSTVLAVNEAVLAGKLLQAASGTCYAEDGSTVVLHDEKLSALESIVEEICGESLAVVVTFKADMTRIKAAFPRARELRTDADMAAWNRGEIEMLLLQPASVGHGVSLQHGGRNLCFYNQLFDWELASQVAERLGPVRQLQSGYDRVVRQFHIVATNTYDETALENLAKKEQVERAVFAATA